MNSEQHETHETLKRIESKIDEHAKTHEKIEARLTSLEHSRAYAAGAVAVITAALGVVWKWFSGGTH